MRVILGGGRISGRIRILGSGVGVGKEGKRRRGRRKKRRKRWAVSCSSFHTVRSETQNLQKKGSGAPQWGKYGVISELEWVITATPLLNILNTSIVSFPKRRNFLRG
jgi:hypothetical protein